MHHNLLMNIATSYCLTYKKQIVIVCRLGIVFVGFVYILHIFFFNVYIGFSFFGCGNGVGF